MKRPVGVTILAVLAIIAGIINVIVALPFLGVTSFLAFSWLTGPIAVIAPNTLLTWGALMVLYGVLLAAVGVAAFQQRPWAWVAGVVLFGLSLILAVVELTTIGAIAGGAVTVALLSAAGLAYMYTTGVRSAFEHDDGSLFHTSHHTPMGAA